MKRLKGRKLASFVSNGPVVWNAAPGDPEGFTPTEAMREEAQRGLEWRAEYGRGGTEVGVARARDIANGRRLSAETVKRMVSYFARHEVDKQGEGFSPGEDGYPSAGRIAWALWGGDPGKSWANAIADRLGASAEIESDEIEGDEVEAEEVASADAEAVAGETLPRFSMIAYTGGAMRVHGWDAPVVVDLAGLGWTAKSRPILKDHSAQMTVGHTTAIRVVGSELVIEGVISGAGEAAREIVASSRNGFPWQSSIGADAGGIEFVEDGETVKANGREFVGPVYVSRRATLGEVSFVALGADDATEARVAAAFVATGSDSGKDTEMDKPQDGEVRASKPDAPEVVASSPTADAVAQIRAEAAAEASRIASVRRIAAAQPEIAAKAIGEGWDETKTELEVLRAERATAAPAGIVRNASTPASSVIEAAVAKTGKLPNIEKHYTAETLEAADSLKNYGLQEMVISAARENGWSGRSIKSDTRGVLQAAFSTLSLPGIFSNVANKFLLAGFTAVDQTWRQISTTRSVSDFKTVSSYRLSGAFAFDEIGAGGQMKHGSVSEEVYTNSAKTYAKMFSVTREDLINDDLGALSALPSRIGRGAALKMNQVFWTTFLDNANLFTAGNNNLKTGNAFGNGIDALTLAEQAFFDQTDPDGFPLALAPSILLVPTALYAKASVAMASAEVRNPSGKDVVANPHAGKFQAITTPYLSNASIPNASASNWYLLANPAELSSIEVAFLNGTETPTVESADADFSVLGIQMRGFFDFGVSLVDPRAAIKNTA